MCHELVDSIFCYHNEMPEVACFFEVKRLILLHNSRVSVPRSLI